MSNYKYSPLPTESDTIRMLRLLPNEDKSAKVKCQLFNYNLSKSGGGEHLYEALSYVWGSEEKPETILVDDSVLHVTENLHAALLHLRDHQLERILWIDAICIDQTNDEEKSRQILFMRMIYGQANRVIVWLGKAADGSDEALRNLCLVAEEVPEEDPEEEDPEEEVPEEDISGDINQAAIMTLLQRPWFRRIWVLQEVGLARSIWIMCGRVKMDGYAFVTGLERLKLPYKGHPGLQSQIRSIAYLMKGAIFRSEYTTNARGAHSIGELIDMYNAQNATKQHDKVYALLGMCSDDPNATALLPNYRLPWNVVFQQVVEYTLPKEACVQTFPNREMAVIKARVLILGRINSVEDDSFRNDRQSVEISFNDIAWSLGHESKWGRQWTLQASSKPIEKGDIVCLLDGARQPSIIRLCKEYFTVIMVRVTLQQTGQRQILAFKSQKAIDPTSSRREILLIWNWETSQINSERNGAKFPTDLNRVAPEYVETDLDQSKRSDVVALIVEDIMMIVVEMEDDGDLAMEILLKQSGPISPIAELVIKAAAENTHDYAHEMLRFLLDQGGETLSITEEVVKTAPGDTGPGGSTIIDLLLDRGGETLPITEGVIKAAAANTSHGYDTMKLLLYRRGVNLPITEEMIKAAAGNSNQGYEMIQFLLDQGGETLLITEGVIKAAAANTSHGYDTMKLLLYRRGVNLPITEEMIKAAAGNSNQGYEMIQFLLDQGGETLPITEEVVKGAAGNTSHGYGIMKLLLDRRGETLPITEEVVKTAAGNTGPWGPTIIDLLLDRGGETLPITEEVIKAAAGNTSQGDRIMELLLDRRGETLPITEEVIKDLVKTTG